jgi:hypothetical protein
LIINHNDDLICDLAEYYHIYDYETMPPLFIATLACGLRDGSRCISALNGTKMPLETLILAGISDKLALLVWFNSKDGQKNVNRPESLVDILSGNKTEEKKQIRGFDSGAEFEAARLQIINGGKNNG